MLSKLIVVVACIPTSIALSCDSCGTECEESFDFTECLLNIESFIHCQLRKDALGLGKGLSILKHKVKTK